MQKKVWQSLAGCIRAVCLPAAVVRCPQLHPQRQPQEPAREDYGTGWLSRCISHERPWKLNRDKQVKPGVYKLPAARDNFFLKNSKVISLQKALNWWIEGGQYWKKWFNKNQIYFMAFWQNIMVLWIILREQMETSASKYLLATVTTRGKQTKSS